VILIPGDAKRLAGLKSVIGSDVEGFH
jgi:hypothetical protein